MLDLQYLNYLIRIFKKPLKIILDLKKFNAKNQIAELKLLVSYSKKYLDSQIKVKKPYYKFLYLLNNESLFILDFISRFVGNCTFNDMEREN